MPQTSTSLTPAERLAARISKLANARATIDAGLAIAEVRRRARATVLNVVIKAGLDRGWLRQDGSAYIVTPTGHPPLMLPRIEVRGDWDLDALAAALEIGR